ncbi:MFS transporter [Sulfuricurvum sp.]|uniref:MFS transporter n=1 Tax=Sulfuricurvum sp. TaxID=2025608 RepID=UPI002E31A5C9|nr:MFS transporter [Sulfuricurvum sp.]HEX5330509.1 MFS transporter [Sulfuricurvum sp.]
MDRLIRFKKKIIAAGIIGNVIEYYDFALIGFLAVMMGHLFFPSNDPFLSLLGSFGAFAAGMIMRPVGALVFGHIGDRVGRRYALMGSLMMMALPTFLIGFLPTYGQIGILAPILLVALRMIQGLSVGGEYASSIVYLVEQSSPNRQNLYGSFVSVGAKIGMALGSGLCGALLWYLGEDAMGEWGWRIPFWASIVIAAAGLYLRRNLADNYVPSDDKTVPIVAILRHHRREFWQFLTIASSIWIFYYTVFVYLPIWLEKSAHLSKVEAGQINTLSIVIGVIFIPLMAMVADKIGSFRVMRTAALALALGIYPLMVGMSIGGYWVALGGSLILVVLLCAFQAPIFASTVMALNYHGYRASFTAVILGSAAGIVGGLTPMLMTSLEKFSGDPYAPASLIAATSLLGWIVLRRAPV